MESDSSATVRPEEASGLGGTVEGALSDNGAESGAAASEAAANKGGKAGRKRASTGPPVAPPPGPKRRNPKTSAELMDATAPEPAETVLVPPTSPLAGNTVAGGAADEDAGTGGSGSNVEVPKLQLELQALRQEYQNLRARMNSASRERVVTRKALCSLLIQVAKSEIAEEQEHLAEERYQLGICKYVMPAGAPEKNQWEGGYIDEQAQRILDRVRTERSDIARTRKQAAMAGKKTAAAGDEAAGTGGRDADADDMAESREIRNSRTEFLKKEEATAMKKKDVLKTQRALHLKRLQTMQAAERSNFKNFPLLGNSGEERYQLLNLIGRGGFSEVYRAYDLEANRFRAVKIHELGKDMSDQARQTYVRKAMRENEIQRSLKHPRVVSLLDCFAISTKAFGIVLELCEGDTLDEHMKRLVTFVEKEAKGITIQILSGLKYMNSNGRNIIHYDLKPGNLFYNFGEVKIADFGLSKQGNASGDSIELTSQGAGTYWYLPPECFVSHAFAASQGEPAKISNKVDVWSTGVIFFELLFGKRPFGAGKSQEMLLKEAMATANAFTLVVPQTPKVSLDAKNFLSRLLTEDRDSRPDVHEAYNDNYIRPQTKAGRATAGAASSAPTGGAA